MKTMKQWSLGLLLCSSAVAFAEPNITVTMNMITENGVDKPIGKVVISPFKQGNGVGVVLTPDLSELPAGLHGFHVHENPSCDPGDKDGVKVAGLAAGSHYDPLQTKQHGPWGEGHLGDLPALYVDKTGKATQALLAPRLKMSDLSGRALVIHENGDNYSDQPAPLGGGGARIACGVIK
jgi:Cu-Zn family superoxide dismutase